MKTVTDTLAQVVQNEPDWAGMPPRIARILKLCFSPFGSPSQMFLNPYRSVFPSGFPKGNDSAYPIPRGPSRLHQMALASFIDPGDNVGISASGAELENTAMEGPGSTL